MENWNEKLEQLQAQIVQKRRLEKRRDTLKMQRQELEAREYELRGQRGKEQADVDRLHGRSLAVWFYTVTGQRAGKLEKEEREAYEAAVRHDAVLRELESVNAELKEIDLGLREVVGCETRYRETLEAKKDYIRRSGTEAAEQLIRLESQLLEYRTMKKELQEAIQVGHQARSTARAALDHLESAGNWGTWDVIGGGGLITDIAKHDHLDRAQDLVESLQVCLRRFKTELNDVAIRADIMVRVEDYLRFADFFFDGLFSAWAVQDRIGQSKSQVREVDSKITNTLRRLETMLDETCRAEMKINGELQTLVLDTTEGEN
ncbi:MAG: hypothetical protein IJF56_05015 [Clostridia bacterium]|nr:hypothetical protein [Clostridia bacterium]